MSVARLFFSSIMSSDRSGQFSLSSRESLVNFSFFDGEMSPIGDDGALLNPPELLLDLSSEAA